MNTKVISYNVKEIIRNGVNLVGDTVGSTMGAKGRYVLINRGHEDARPTKDGVSVSLSIRPKDNALASVVKAVQSASIKAVMESGDGPQSIDTQILTPIGYVRFGDIKVGDVVCGTDYSTQEVVGVYPKGFKEEFKVTFSGGAEAFCCEDHLWTVRDKNGVEKTVPLKDIMNDYDKEKYYVKTAEAKFFEDKSKMPLDPYFLGLLLGDGSLSGTGAIELSLGLNKEHIIDKIKAPEGVVFSCNYKENRRYFRIKFRKEERSSKKIEDYLKELGLFGTKSKTKFIPNAYLYSSVESRKALLQGLLDTDAHINKRGLFEFSSVSEELANDLASLCRGLGMQVTTRKKNRENCGGYSETPVYMVTERVGYEYGQQIVGIEKTGKTPEMQCIMVSNPDHLYITDNYVVTHNTSLTAVLTQSLINNGLDNFKDGTNPIDVKRGMEYARDLIVKKLKEISKPIDYNDDMLKHVATVSANNDSSIGELVAQAMNRVTKDGVIRIEDSMTSETVIEVKDAYEIDSGFISASLATNKRGESDYTNPAILLTDDTISNFRDIESSVLFSVKNNVPLVIIASGFEGEVPATVISNVAQSKINVNLIKIPGTGSQKKEHLLDLAALTGAKIVSKSMGVALADASEEHFGRSARVISNRKTTLIEGGVGSNVQERIEVIKNDAELIDDKSQKDWFEKRASKLLGKIAIIKVGGGTDLERKEIIDRLDDSLRAATSALKEGVVPGGGICLLKISKELEVSGEKDFSLGMSIVKEACKAPVTRMTKNAGLDSKKILDKLLNSKSFEVGYNLETNEYANMYDDGVVDSALVVRVALESAISVAQILLTTEHIIIDEE